MAQIYARNATLFTVSQIILLHAPVRPTRSNVRIFSFAARKKLACRRIYRRPNFLQQKTPNFFTLNYSPTLFTLSRANFERLKGSPTKKKRKKKKKCSRKTPDLVTRWIDRDGRTQ